MVKNNIIFFSLLPLKLGINTEKKMQNIYFQNIFTLFLYLCMPWIFLLKEKLWKYEMNSSVTTE